MSTQQDTITLDNVAIGDELPPITFPLTVYRLVMWAGAGRDFNSIHHNSEYARQTGAPEMYANVGFLMATWERLVREWAGPGGFITGIRGFRMSRFNTVGQTLTTTGTVTAIDGDTVTIKAATSDNNGVTVGPGTITIQFPAKPV